MVVPNGNVEPEAGEQFTGTVPSFWSVAVGVGYATTAPLAVDGSTVMFAGTPERTGSELNTTCTAALVEALVKLPSPLYWNCRVWFPPVERVIEQEAMLDETVNGPN